MKRIMTLLVSAAACGLLATSLAAASARPALQLHKTKLGTILVNSRGFTVYAYTADGRNRDTCASESGCLTVWPVVAGSGRLVLGRGVRSSLVGRIKLKGVGEQVTYAGHPLYTYISDTRPAETSWVNVFEFKGRWPALNAAGQEVR